MRLNSDFRRYDPDCLCADCTAFRDKLVDQAQGGADAGTNAAIEGGQFPRDGIDGFSGATEFAKATRAVLATPFMRKVASESEQRKATPIFSGVLRYFPDALAAVARLSKAGNDKHNPGQPLHWARDKSKDHGDCIARHQITFDQIDEETGEYHAVAVAWRALAQLQLLEEAKKTKPELWQKWLPSWKFLPGGRVDVRFRNGQRYMGLYADLLNWDERGDGTIVEWRRA